MSTIQYGDLSYADDSGDFIGNALHGSRYTPPYLTSSSQKEGLPIVQADYVTADSGTGLVHSAPAHGMDDYATWKAQEAASASPMPAMASYVDADGKYSSSIASEIVSPSVDHLVGLSVLSSAPLAVLNDLKQRKLLFASPKIRHKYPYDWRTKQPVIVRSTPQWFANVENIKESAVEALNAVNFVPEQGTSSKCCYMRIFRANPKPMQVEIDCKHSLKVAPSGAFPDRDRGAYLYLYFLSTTLENHC